MIYTCPYCGESHLEFPSEVYFYLDGQQLLDYVLIECGYCHNKFPISQAVVTSY